VSVVSECDGFPRSLLEFQSRFATESACAAYLFERRWSEGFVCPGCGQGRAWLPKTKAFTYVYAGCGPGYTLRSGSGCLTIGVHLSCRTEECCFSHERGNKDGPCVSWTNLRCCAVSGPDRGDLVMYFRMMRRRSRTLLRIDRRGNSCSLMSRVPASRRGCVRLFATLSIIFA
jgi:hypothetical protein